MVVLLRWWVGDGSVVVVGAAQLMALSVTDDLETQERVWDSMSSYERHASNLPRHLLAYCFERQPS